MKPTPPLPLPDDAALQRALRGLPTAGHTDTNTDTNSDTNSDIDDLTMRVLHDWQARHGDGVQPALQTAGRGGASLGARLRQRRLWVGSAGLVALAVVATTLFVTRHDPVLDELMQPDVLSEMAIGEM